MFKFMPPQKDAATGNVTWNLAMPADKQIPAYAVEDTGAFVVEVFNHPEKWLSTHRFLLPLAEIFKFTIYLNALRD